MIQGGLKYPTMRVAILTQYYPPEMGAASARLSELAEAFVERGHDVIVLTAMPNYPTGKIFPGYKGLVMRECYNKVTVIRSFIYPSRNSGIFPRLANYFSFVLSSLCVGLVTIPHIDFLITQSPPLFLGISGYFLSRVKRARWIFNVSDLWPESAVRLGLLENGVRLKLARSLETFCYKKAWLVTGQSQEIVQNITSRFPNVPTYHLSNGVNTSVFTPECRSELARQELGGGHACIAVYSGLLGVAQGLDQLLLAASMLASVRELTFVFVGEGREKERLVQMSSELQLNNVRFLGPYPREMIPTILASSDIALVPLRTRIPGAVPSKLYEAMAAGLPVILIANGEAADIVKDTQAGIVVQPGDVESLASVLLDLSSDHEKRKQLGANGRRASTEQFDRRLIAAKFIAFLEEQL